MTPPWDLWEPTLTSIVQTNVKEIGRDLFIIIKHLSLLLMFLKEQYCTIPINYIKFNQYQLMNFCLGKTLKQTKLLLGTLSLKGGLKG